MTTVCLPRALVALGLGGAARNLGFAAELGHSLERHQPTLVSHVVAHLPRLLDQDQTIVILQCPLERSVEGLLAQLLVRASLFLRVPCLVPVHFDIHSQNLVSVQAATVTSELDCTFVHHSWRKCCHLQNTLSSAQTAGVVAETVFARDHHPDAC